MKNKLQKLVMFETKEGLGYCSTNMFNKLLYETEIKISRMLLLECSDDFVDYIQEENKSIVASIIDGELQQDSGTIYSN